MAVRIEKTDLPGIGTRHDVITEGGRRVGVVAHRTGEREIAVFDVADPDACSASVSLTDAEAAALADVLGTSVLMSELSNIREQAAGLATEQFVLPAGSPYAGGLLGDTKARTRTSTSIVAIVRGAEVIPSPGPDAPLRAGDTVVAVGTRAGLDALSTLLAGPA
jgi:TrkA domain protein